VPKVEIWQLRQRQGLPLELKERYAERRIQEWYEYWDGQVFVSFSGGKDSNVLLHLVRRFYPDVSAVFCNTGLEHPEILTHVKTFENVTWLLPKMPFDKVVERYGYPVVSKKVARCIKDLQNPNPRNEATRHLRLTGYNRKGAYCPSQKLPQKWRYLVDSGIKISDHCCEVIKKKRTDPALPKGNRPDADDGCFGLRRALGTCWR